MYRSRFLCRLELPAVFLPARGNNEYVVWPAEILYHALEKASLHCQLVVVVVSWSFLYELYNIPLRDSELCAAWEGIYM